jgi:hypothetical protein
LKGSLGGTVMALPAMMSQDPLPGEYEPYQPVVPLPIFSYLTMRMMTASGDVRRQRKKEGPYPNLVFGCFLWVLSTRCVLCTWFRRPQLWSYLLRMSLEEINRQSLETFANAYSR